jgi:hypothetical protein
VHEGGVEIRTLDNGAFRFIKPNGESFESRPPASAGWADLVAAHAGGQVEINPQTAVTRWTGEALDLDVAVGWLMQKGDCATNVSAETSRTI